MKRFWTANNKVSEPRPFLRDRQPQSIFIEARLGERACVHVFFEQEKVQTNESQTREPAVVTITSMSFGTVSSFRGGLEFGSGHKHSHWQSDQWVIPADCNTVTHGGWGGWRDMTQQNVTSRLLCMMQDHLTAGRVETITADFAGWVYDSLTRVSQNPGTRGYSLCLCVLTVYVKAPLPT